MTAPITKLNIASKSVSATLDPEIIQLVLRLNDEGLTHAAIAKRSRLHINTVRSMLDPDYTARCRENAKKQAAERAAKARRLWQQKQDKSSPAPEIQQQVIFEKNGVQAYSIVRQLSNWKGDEQPRVMKIALPAVSILRGAK